MTDRDAVTETKKKSVRQRDIEQIAGFAKDAFKDHVVIPKMVNGVYRHYECRNKDGSSVYYFSIVTYPGYLVVSGDLGEMVLHRAHDMLHWAKSAVNSIDYFEEKVVAGKTKVYSGDLAREEIEEARSEQRDWNEEDQGDDKLECFDGFHDFDNPHETYTAIYECGFWDGCDMPDLETFSPRFLWLRECVKWFLEHWSQDEENNRVENHTPPSPSA